MDPAALQVLHYVLAARARGVVETVELPGADLRGAQLARADLVGARLPGAGLEHAQLAGAKLGGADLQSVLAQWADLSGADLTGADLRQADLAHARLEGASLADCDLRGACIFSVVGEPASIVGARLDRAAAERSQLGDDDLIRLFGLGVLLDGLESFSEPVQHACSAKAAEVVSDVGPPTRKLAHVEREARRHRLRQDGETPPSARLTEEAMRLLALRGDREPAPMSTRSLKLVAGILTPAILAAPGWREGDTVLGVELVRLLGEGSAAQVWQGRGPDGEEVAVKLFRSERASVGLTLPAYRRGVQVVNRLVGARIEGVVELRAVSLNKLGMVMALARNGSAVDLPALAWPVKSAVEFFAKLCAAVGRAHGAGALHRCIKPANILLDENLAPVLGDFDMVDLPTLAAESADAGGYAPYAAPEELLASGTQSPTADIFSLGRVLQFLLLGRDPDETPEDVPKLAALAGQPVGLVRIIRKCTMRAPEAHYQWVKELVEDLRRYEDHERVGIAGESPEHGLTPLRVSALPHQPQWLAHRAPRGSIGAARRTTGRDLSRRPTAETAPERSAVRDRLIGTAGLVLLAGGLVAVRLAGRVPSASLLVATQWLSALGAAAATFLAPRLGSSPALWRAVLAILAAAVLYLANLPASLAPAGYAPVPSSPPAPDEGAK